MPGKKKQKGNADKNIISTWCIVTQKPNGHRVTMLKPRPSLCNNQCPWLTTNHGKSTKLYYDHEVQGISLPGKFSFAPWKRVKIWKNDLQNGTHGYGGLCHVRLKGTELTKSNTWNVVSHQCTGALVMQQRELLRHIEQGHSALTSEGAARVATDILGRNITGSEVHKLDIEELLEHMHPSLLDPDIGCHAVAPLLSEIEKENWKLPKKVLNGSSKNFL